MNNPFLLYNLWITWIRLWFPNNKYHPNNTNYLPCLLMGGFSIREKGILLHLLGVINRLPFLGTSVHRPKHQARDSYGKWPIYSWFTYSDGDFPSLQRRISINVSCCPSARGHRPIFGPPWNREREVKLGWTNNSNFMKWFMMVYYTQITMVFMGYYMQITMVNSNVTMVYDTQITN